MTHSDLTTERLDATLNALAAKAYNNPRNLRVARECRAAALRVLCYNGWTTSQAMRTWGQTYSEYVKSHGSKRASIVPIGKVSGCPRQTAKYCDRVVANLGIKVN